MVCVQLKYNPYIPSLEALYDGIPVSIYSDLREYSDSEFHTWLHNIFDVLYSEINDSYSIEYVGQAAEFELLKLYASQHTHCTSLTHTLPQIHESPLQRSRRLSNLAINGVVSLSLKKKVNVCISSVEGLFSCVNMPRLSYCIFKKINTVILDTATEAETIRFKLCRSMEECEDAVKACSHDTHVILCTDTSCSSDRWLLVGGKAVICCDKDTLNEAVNDILNVSFYPKLLRDVVLSNNSSSVHSDDYTNLLRLDPAIKVIIPGELEIGVETKLEIYGVDSPDRIRMRQTGVDIVTLNHGVLRAHDVGVAHIQLFDATNGETLAAKDVRCVKKKHLTHLTLNPSELSMTVDEHHPIMLIMEPAKNDDVRFIRYVSSNPFVACEMNGEIWARGVGECTVTAVCGNITSRCTVKVYPRITGLAVSPTEIEMTVGEVRRVSFSQIPPTSLPVKHTVNVYPSDIAVCNLAGGMIQANKPGSATVRISAGEVYSNIKITVYPKESKPDTKKVTYSEADDTDEFWGKLFKRR